MKDNQNKFYTSISKYYSEIFPYKPAQLQFVRNKVGQLNKKQILDIGCATGELAYQMAKAGADVSGIDLNEDLLEQAKRNKQLPNLHFKKGDMLKLQKDYSQHEFDVALCFGNTLVHLPDFNSVRIMLQGVESILKPGGKFLMQILNYDYIVGQQVSELPLIETENIKFTRRYNFPENSLLIQFSTELQIKKSGETITNSTKLLAVQSNELSAFLQEAGFQNIEFFSNFKSEKFGGKHLPLVVSATR